MLEQHIILPAMNRPYQYQAFICYNHQNRDFASRLHLQLNSFRLPDSLKKQFPELPVSLSPVFRDENNLSVGPLTENIQKALDDSRFLIVICSPQAASPCKQGRHYITEEINHFLCKSPEERIKRIIPVILRDSEEVNVFDCLPPILRWSGLLGVDPLVKGYKRCICDIEACLLGIDPSILWEALGEQDGDDGNSNESDSDPENHVEYYADYVERHNVPHGLFKLSEREIKARHYHYRFTYIKDLLVEVTCCNSVGIPVKPRLEWLEDRPAGMKLDYNMKGHVVSRIQYDEHSKENVELLFSGNGKFIDFQTVGGMGIRRLSQLDLPKQFNENKESFSSVTRLSVERDERGCITRKKFRNIYRMPEPDEHGVWGYRYERDVLGRIVAMISLDGKDNPVEDKHGAAGYRLSYGDNSSPSSVVRMFWVDGNGQPSSHRDGWAEMSLMENKNGNISEISYKGSDGLPCLHRDGYAKVTMNYDDKGNCIERNYFGVDGRRCLNSFGFSRIIRQFDERGNCIHVSYFDVKGKPCSHKDGGTTVNMKYDDRGYLIEQAYFDADGKPCLDKENVARITIRRDVNGNLREWVNYGIDNKPCVDIKQVSKATWRYDERENVIKQSFFGVDGKACENKDHISIIKWKYDERENNTEESYYGVNGKPCLNNKGISKITWKRDIRGNITEQAYFGTDGKPCLDIDKIAVARCSYDEMGNSIEESYYGINGEPCLLRGLYAKLKVTYDHKRNPIEEATFDIEGNPCPDANGCARKIYVRDRKGKVIRVKCYDKSGKLLA